MTAPGLDLTAAIESHSSGLVAAATGHLDAGVEHCPGWSVADLVHHVTEVQWFWATIVEERLSQPPDESRRPERAAADDLLAVLTRATGHLVGVLRSADQAAQVWTWAPAQNDVAFVTRHQVQEAAVHHWDAANAAGHPFAIETPVAVDSIEELLTFSVSSDADPADPPRPALDGAFGLRCSDSGAAWTISDGGSAGTVRWSSGSSDAAPAITASSSDLLLWLYGRGRVDTTEVPAGLVERFRALCFTA